jgi:hypothetical protein
MAAPTVSDKVAHYDVRSGDTLWTICSHQVGDITLVADLAKLNGLDPKATLSVGQRLIVPDFRRYDLTVKFIHAEMVAHLHHEEVFAIEAALMRSRQFRAQGEEALEDMRRAKWYQMFRVLGDQELFKSDMNAAGAADLEAKARWFLQVRAGGPWDQKDQLRAMYLAMPSPPRPFGDLNKAYHFPIRGDLFREFYYDIWSNIHYGYVGARCGFDDHTLQYYAALRLPGTGTNDIGDEISTQIGIDLWRAVGPSVTPDLIRKAILGKAKDYETARAKDGTDTVITNNDYK